MKKSKKSVKKMSGKMSASSKKTKPVKAMPVDKTKAARKSRLQDVPL